MADASFKVYGWWRGVEWQDLSIAKVSFEKEVEADRLLTLDRLHFSHRLLLC